MTYSEELLREVYQQLLESPEDRINFASKQFHVAPGFVKVYAKSDPTKNLEYISWITKQAKRRYVKFPEDSEKIYETLTIFDRVKRLGNYKGQKDINKFEQYGDLAQQLQEFGAVQSNQEHQRIQIENGVEEIYNHSTVKIFQVTTPEAGAKLFRDTKWCVKDPKYFKSYGPPFYMLTLNNQPYFLIHVEKHQIKSPNDMIPTQYELDKVPNVMMALHSIPGMTEAVKDAGKPVDVDKALYEATIGLLGMIIDYTAEDPDGADMNAFKAFFQEYPNIKSSASMGIPNRLVEMQAELCHSDRTYVRDSILTNNSDFAIFTPQAPPQAPGEDWTDWYEIIHKAVHDRWPKFIKSIYDETLADEEMRNILKRYIKH